MCNYGGIWSREKEIKILKTKMNLCGYYFVYYRWLNDVLWCMVVGDDKGGGIYIRLWMIVVYFLGLGFRFWYYERELNYIIWLLLR